MFLFPCRNRSRQALTVRTAAITPSFTQAAPTARLKVPRGAACCHACCLGCVIRHGSSCVLHPASFSRPSLHFITLHSLSSAHVHYVRVMIQRARIFSPFRGRPNRGSAHNHKLHALPSHTHSSSFRFIQSSFTQQAADHLLPLLCRPASFHFA